MFDLVFDTVNSADSRDRAAAYMARIRGSEGEQKILASVFVAILSLSLSFLPSSCFMYAHLS